GKLADVVPATKLGKIGGSLASKVANVQSGEGFLGKLFKGTGNIFLSILTIMFVLGALLSTYIPLIPFITWFSALTNYFSVVFEGFIAAQLWAMNHITTDGEGLAQRTERGYTHVLNVRPRPTIMVLAFFLASALNIALGTLFLKMFAAALANAQGNSVTGLASIVAFVVIYVVSLIVMVQSIFNLIH